MTAIHQVLAGAAPRDAITNHALETREIIRGLGLKSEIFAEGRHIDSTVRDRVHPHSEWSLWAKDGDALIIHYSIDSSAFHELLPRCGRAGMQYHNITPPDLLWRYSPTLARQCADGRRRLVALATRVDVPAADSAFNAQELLALGFGEPHVVGILRDRTRMLGRARHGGGAERLLFVGRGVANKAQDEAILVLASLRQAGVDAQLRLAGAWGPGSAFEARCRWLTQRLGVEDAVAFLGSISDDALADEYAAATVFVSMSRHEGYFVPAIEAMEANLPIVARAAGAVPETVGDAGLLIAHATPSSVAEGVIAVQRPDVAGKQSAARQVQLHHHSAPETTKRLVRFLEDLG